MRLLYSKPSAFSRKVRLAAAALGISDRIELLAVNPVADRDMLREINPLGKIPVLVAEGVPIFDSSVICRYLDERFGPGTIIPLGDDKRMKACRLEALGDGVIEAGMLLRAEMMRSEGARDAGVESNQRGKVLAGLDYLEARASELGASWTVGQIAVASALGWLQFRLGDQGFFEGKTNLGTWYEALLRRPDVQETRPDA